MNIIEAKSYLNEEELTTLNLIVSQYLDFAELQARGRKPMYMTDWKAKLDAFLALNDELSALSGELLGCNCIVVS